jgi:hypothetical protein
MSQLDLKLMLELLYKAYRAQLKEKKYFLADSTKKLIDDYENLLPK